ncbi:MAG TPA: OmpA family protein [Anaeromyxobacteraceae bacterium]|nr:OmpA family protein [Anaeromyxobacteraceae bacterium]
MTRPIRCCALLAGLAAAFPAAAQNTPWDLGKQAAGSAATGSLEKEINKRLLDESRKNQCSFKSDSDVLEKGCDPKARKLADAVVSAKKKLESAGVHSFKFEVSGHTDSSGSASHNEDLSKRRAERMKKELVAKGVPDGDVVAVGLGSKRPVVKPDDTPQKKAKNRRYEVQVRL